eukprot:3408856-Amphidinium_carterae.1
MHREAIAALAELVASRVQWRCGVTEALCSASPSQFQQAAASSRQLPKCALPEPVRCITWLFQASCVQAFASVAAVRFAAPLRKSLQLALQDCWLSVLVVWGVVVVKYYQELLEESTATNYDNFCAN